MISPDDVTAIEAQLGRPPRSIHAIGTRHSFNAIGDADELVSLAKMPGGKM